MILLYKQTKRQCLYTLYTHIYIWSELSSYPITNSFVSWKVEVIYACWTGDAPSRYIILTWICLFTLVKETSLGLPCSSRSIHINIHIPSGGIFETLLQVYLLPPSISLPSWSLGLAPLGDISCRSWTGARKSHVLLYAYFPARHPKQNFKRKISAKLQMDSLEENFFNSYSPSVPN